MGVPTPNPITRARRRLHARYLPWLSAALLATQAPGHAAAGFETSADGAEARPWRVFVSILPQKHFVERVGGERVIVEVLVGPGRSPATYEPTPRQMARLAAADLLLTAGVPFEAVWLPRLRRAHPGLTIRDSTAGIARLAMDARHHDLAPAVAGKEPDGGRGDPHVWTDPRNASAMAKQIAAALADLDPAGALRYQAGAASFGQAMTALDAELREILVGLAGRRFLVFHPSWGYFAAAYGLEQVAIEVGGKEPGARALSGLIETARAEQIRAVFVQAQFSRALAERVAAEVGAAVITVDPLAEDYAANLRRVAAALAEALR